jgi:hypothetical protein
MALTSDQLADMQADLGITDDEAVFTDVELNRLYERAGSDYDKAVYYGWRQLLANVAKFHNYTAGMTKVERGQVFDHVERMVSHWEGKVKGAQQVGMAGLLSIPPKSKDAPSV